MTRRNPLHPRRTPDLRRPEPPPSPVPDPDPAPIPVPSPVPSPGPGPEPWLTSTSSHPAGGLEAGEAVLHSQPEAFPLGGRPHAEAA